jgi:hypothetical protein
MYNVSKEKNARDEKHCNRNKRVPVICAWVDWTWLRKNLWAWGSVNRHSEHWKTTRKEDWKKWKKYP